MEISLRLFSEERRLNEQEEKELIVEEMTNIYVWIRTARSLQFFYPTIDVDSSKSSDPFSDFYEIAIDVIELLKECDRISFDEFENLCKLRISEIYIEAIFQNAVEHGNLNARLKLLTFSLLFAGLQQKTSDLSGMNRNDVVLTRISKYFGPIFKLLFQLDVGKRLQDRDIVQAIGSGQGYEFLDVLFEGTVKHKHGISNQHGVRPLSHIVPLILEKANGISLPFLCNEIRRHLIKDPYHIDEFSSEKSVQIFNTVRRTTLAHNSRRVVHLHYINRIEVLRKDEFANVHLRICNDKPKASFVFVPLRCETVFLDSLFYTKYILLGAVRGIVIIKDCQGTRISVSCDQLIIMDSKNLEVHFMSPKKPLVSNSQNITFAPFNTIYEGQQEFLEENGHYFENNLVMKEPIIFKNGSWKMDTSKFVCQSTPLHATDKQFEILLNSLPEEYRISHYRNTVEAQKLMAMDSEKCRVNDVVSNFDLLYLKSKIEKKGEGSDENESRV
ncbi:hypothetical protein GCK72_001096 [Caenorhabditis remanei]|uniref:TBCC domain-containing protein 1 n=1 Tax=Caenorhabditis remanei TaxID=31234 RepID=A0A6A5HM43_CAERE|nr:hypothetical protein GCK72_001096 [Caenorhabditis remanei]KAF1769280.1 hypothetical protein GCK72_001096 [Caenorhabditis remanei]